MNVNSRGHNLDTKFEQFILEIKHPPGINTRWVYPPPRVSLKSINTPRTDLRGSGHSCIAPFLLSRVMHL